MFFNILLIATLNIVFAVIILVGLLPFGSVDKTTLPDPPTRNLPDNFCEKADSFLINP